MLSNAGSPGVGLARGYQCTGRDDASRLLDSTSSIDNSYL